VAGFVGRVRRGSRAGAGRCGHPPGPGQPPRHRLGHPVVRDPHRPRRPSHRPYCAHASPDEGFPGVRAVPARVLAARTSPDNHPAAWSARLASLKFQWLENGECGHRREGQAYRPGRRLRHLIMIRQRTLSCPTRAAAAPPRTATSTTPSPTSKAAAPANAIARRRECDNHTGCVGISVMPGGRGGASSRSESSQVNRLGISRPVLLREPTQLVLDG
jgi:hypothetical protein